MGGMGSSQGTEKSKQHRTRGKKATKRSGYLVSLRCYPWTLSYSRLSSEPLPLQGPKAGGAQGQSSYPSLDPAVGQLHPSDLEFGLFSVTMGT